MEDKLCSGAGNVRQTILGGEGNAGVAMSVGE